MNEASQRERNLNDAFFLERLDTFMDKCLEDIRAFSERESRPLEETRRYVAEWHARYLFQPRTSLLESEQRSPRSDRIYAVLCDTSQTLESLYETTGVQSFLLAVDPTDPANPGFLGGSLSGREFWRRMRNGGEVGAKAFRTYCQKQLATPLSESSSSAEAGDAAKPPETSLKKTTAKNLKSELYEKIRMALRKESGVHNAEMKWTNAERLDVYGVRLVGWPSDIPAQNPSHLKQNQNKQLLQALESGSLKFEKILQGLCNTQDYNVSDTLGEESIDAEQDIFWSYDADGEISRASVSGKRSSASTDDPKFDYGDYLNLPGDIYDVELPPIKRARTEEYEIDS